MRSSRASTFMAIKCAMVATSAVDRAADDPAAVGGGCDIAHEHVVPQSQGFNPKLAAVAPVTAKPADMLLTGVDGRPDHSQVAERVGGDGRRAIAAPGVDQLEPFGAAVAIVEPKGVGRTTARCQAIASGAAPPRLVAPPPNVTAPASLAVLPASASPAWPPRAACGLLGVCGRREVSPQLVSAATPVPTTTIVCMTGRTSEPSFVHALPRKCEPLRERAGSFPQEDMPPRSDAQVGGYLEVPTAVCRSDTAARKSTDAP